MFNLKKYSQDAWGGSEIDIMRELSDFCRTKGLKGICRNCKQHIHGLEDDAAKKNLLRIYDVWEYQFKSGWAIESV